MSRSDFAPTASWKALRRRAELLRETREFFHERAFLECETPLLSRDSVIDLHLDPIGVVLFHDPRAPEQGPRYWLQTSPEFGMKRLLAAGAPSLYQISKAFRGGERGAMHNPEFTIVEWYGVGHDYVEGMNTLEALVTRLLKTAPAERITYREAFLRFASLDPFTATESELAEAARSAGLASQCDDRDGWLEYLMSTLVEPRLGWDRPVIVYDYPASQAALARVRAEEHSVAERFELYYRGVELANGYHELQDAGTLRERNRAANERRTSDGKYLLPEESRLLDALESGLPACAGCALGFDRLVMLALGASEISEVLAFPIERA